MGSSAVVESPARERIEEMVRRIADRFHPEKIILFGSQARGTAGADSDADLLVVMPWRVPAESKPLRLMWPSQAFLSPLT